MWTCILHGLAVASPLDTSVLASAASDPSGRNGLTWLGAQAGVEGNVKRFAFGGRLLGGPTLGDSARASKVAIGLQPTARTWLFRKPRGGLSTVLGAGVEFSERVAPLLSAGVAYDLRRPYRRVRPRWEGTVYSLPSTQEWRLGLSIGLVFRRREARPDVAAPMTIDTDGVAWVPMPVCDWRTMDELTNTEASATALLDSKGFRWLDVRAGSAELSSTNADGTIALEEAPPTSKPAESAPGPNVVIAAFPADEVWVDAVRYPVDDQGIAVMTLVDGMADVIVRGGGRERRFDVMVASSTTLWLSAEAPTPIRVPFAVGQAALDEMGEAAVQSILENLGGWSYEIRGSYSPDGAPQRNQELASQRAASVADALTSAGVVPEQVRVLETSDVDETDDEPDALRVAIVYPVETEP